MITFWKWVLKGSGVFIGLMVVLGWIEALQAEANGMALGLVLAGVTAGWLLWSRKFFIRPLWRGSRRGGRRLCWWLFEFFWHNTRQRLGRFEAFRWLCMWIGFGLTLWWAFHRSWWGALYLALYWSMVWVISYLHERYARWQFLRFRLPGRFRWSGIGQEAKDAGGRLASSFRQSGRGRKYGR